MKLPVAIGILVMLSCSALAQNNAKPSLLMPDNNQRTSEHRQSEAAREQNQPNQSMLGETPSPQHGTNAAEDERREKREKAAVDERLAKATEQLADYTLGLFVATIGLAVLTLGLLGFAVRQASDAKISGEASKRSADAADKSAAVAKDALIASTRPWIRVKVQIGSGQFILNEQGCQCPIKMSYDNTGNAPALNLMPQIWMLALDSGEGQLETRHNAKCVAARESEYRWHHSLFPGESFPQVEGVDRAETPARASIEEVESGLGGHIYNASGPTVQFYVGGCVNYVIPSDPSTVHQTRFLYHLHGADRVLAGGTRIVHTSHLSLTLPPNGLGNGAD